MNSQADTWQKRVWSKEQDQALAAAISELGAHKWDDVAQALDMRTGKQCRERWHNQLNPLLRKTPWSEEECWILFIMQEAK